MTTLARPVTLQVIETFRTIQGEGPFTGQAATFLRLSGCNLKCTWCDSRYSWDWNQFDRNVETATVLAPDVAAGLVDTRLLVVTGGEPLLQRRGIAALLEHLPTSVACVQFETNGTRSPAPLAGDPRCYFVVSPKLANAGDPVVRRIVPGVLAEFGRLARTGAACLKVVVQTEEDVMQARVIADIYEFPRRTVWILPEGLTRDEHLTTLERVADATVRHGFNLSARLHLLAWPEVTRGR